MFLTVDDIIRLTGYKHKAKQCEQLQAMHIPYRLNASGDPIVNESYINGTKPQQEHKKWQPAILSS